MQRTKSHRGYEPIWAVDSTQNRGVIEKLRAENPNDLTLFKVKNLEERTANAISVIEDVELHHPRMKALKFIGIARNENFSNALKDFGYALDDGIDLSARKIS